VPCILSFGVLLLRRDWRWKGWSGADPRRCDGLDGCGEELNGKTYPGMVMDENRSHLTLWIKASRGH
jgi:hypothetical protein